MQKLFTLSLLAAILLGGCKKETLTDTSHDIKRNGFFVSFYLVDEKNQPLFKRDVDYSGHPYDPKLFMAYGITANSNLGELQYIDNQPDADVTFVITEYFTDISPNFPRNEADTLMIWYACWGNKCDTITMRTYNWDEIISQDIKAYNNAAKWITYNQDTIYNHIPLQALRIRKILY